MNMISTTPIQVFALSVQGIVVAPFVFALLPIIYFLIVNPVCDACARMRRQLFNLSEPQKTEFSTAWRVVIRDKLFGYWLASALFIVSLCLVINAMYGRNGPDWPVVENTTTCVILLQMGDSYLAADDLGNGRIQPTFTIYRADKLPSFGMRRLGNLTGAPQEPNTSPPRTTCPKVGDSDAKHP
jgi:hypothetical protein